MLLDLIVTQAAAVALVVSRLAGFVVVSPFPGRWVPARMRVLLVLVMAFPLSFTMPVPHALALDLSLLLPAVSDFLVGFLIGAAFYLVLAAAEFMAGMVSQASWLSAPMSMNPASGDRSQVLAQVATLFALLLALSAGVHRVVLAYLFESMHLLPLGTPLSVTAALPMFIEIGGRSFDVGMRLAMPVFAVSLAVQAALALVSRVAPSLQIFNVGFAVLVASGLVTFGASMRAISVGIIGYAGELPGFLDEVLVRLAEG